MEPGSSPSGCRELWIGPSYGVISLPAQSINLVMVRLNVNAPALHEGYHARWDNAHVDGEDRALWRTEIPLMVDEQVLGRIEVTGVQDQESVREKMDSLLKLVEYFEIEASSLVRNHLDDSATQMAEPADGQQAARRAAVISQPQVVTAESAPQTKGI